MFWMDHFRRWKLDWQATFRFFSLIIFFFAALGHNNENCSSAEIKTWTYAGEEMNRVSADIPKKRCDCLVLIGASFAEGWNPGKLAGWKLVNKGIGGEKSSDMLARFERDVIDLNPRAVIIWGFINDIFGSNREEIKDTNRRTIDDLKKMVTRTSEAKVIPILATEATIRPPETLKETIMEWVGSMLGKKGYHQFVNKQVLEVNQWIREFAQLQQIILLDFQSQLADESGMRKKEYSAEDGSHLSAAAYGRLTAYSEKILEGIPGEPFLSNQERKPD